MRQKEIGTKAKRPREPHRGRLTAQKIYALWVEAERTGVSPERLFIAYPLILNTYSARKIRRWLGGRDEVVPLKDYRLVLALWRSLPDRELLRKNTPRLLARLRTGEYVESAPEILEQLRAERQRTGVGINTLLRDRPDIPDGFSTHIARKFCSGGIRTIKHAYLEYLRRLWADLPTREYVAMTPDILADLRSRMERTGKGAYAILRGAKDRPDSLTSSTVLSWLKGVQTARKDHLDYVFRCYDHPEKIVLVTQAQRAEIRRHVRRTGVMPDKMVKMLGLNLTAPDNLKQPWPATRMREQDLHVLLERWRALPERRRGC